MVYEQFIFFLLYSIYNHYSFLYVIVILYDLLYNPFVLYNAIYIAIHKIPINKKTFSCYIRFREFKSGRQLLTVHIRSSELIFKMMQRSLKLAKNQDRKYDTIEAAVKWPVLIIY